MPSPSIADKGTVRRGTRTTFLAVLALLAIGVGVGLQPAQASAEAKLKAKIGWGPLGSKLSLIHI